MKSTEFRFNCEQLYRLLPFHIAINKELKITSAGKSIAMVCNAEHNIYFSDYFRIIEPEFLSGKFDDLIALDKKFAAVETRGNKKMLLMGEIEFMEEENICLFTGALSKPIYTEHELRHLMLGRQLKPLHDLVQISQVNDIISATAQKNLEEELKIAKVKAEDSSKAKELFLATMSHEIRTPLNAIVGITDLMQMNIKTRNRENFDILNFSARSLLALITDILDLTKIDAGKIELSKTPVDLAKLVSGVMLTFKPVCEKKHVDLIIDMEAAVPEIIIGDELRLSQILNNLIGNSVKFTLEGHIKITVSTAEGGHGKTRIQFMVSDTGIGIKKSKIKSIFRAFEQAEKNTVRQFGGTGLGLSITKKLIELQNGKISVQSIPGKGSTFSFYIDYEISKNKRKLQTKVRHAREHFLINDKRVLLIEDNIANQKVAIAYFNNWGLHYDVANHGAEALQMMNRTQYDLALIDLYMPVMDGFEIIKRIRKTGNLKHLPIIALTASAEISLMEKALSWGADKCLTKPFNAQHLRTTMMGLLMPERNVGNEIEDDRKHIFTNDYQFIDLKGISDASLGSEKFIGEMIVLLKKEIPELMSQAESLLMRGEYLSFSKILHKMKNNILMLGIETLHDDLRFMEKHAAKKTKIREVKVAFERLHETWKLALPELDKAHKRQRNSFALAADKTRI